MERESSNGGSRPVWGRTGQGGSGPGGMGMSRVQNDFPTAAEAAEAAHSTSSFLYLLNPSWDLFEYGVCQKDMYLVHWKDFARRAEFVLIPFSLSVALLSCGELRSRDQTFGEEGFGLASTIDSDRDGDEQGTSAERSDDAGGG